uniref:Amine oxidase domain-containing protein n=1 Tax=Psilocybe cubensis TaxID=181762 RepID=A0A8H7XZA6_PSICU
MSFSHNYVNKILEKLPGEQLHLACPVESVRNVERSDGGNPQVILSTKSGEEITYDHVILACHSDAALDILRNGGITDEEERILSQFEWNRNEAVLHSDVKLMPKNRKAWSCWNYLSFTKPLSSNVGRILNSDGMNDLQHLPESKYGPILVTLNPPFEPDKDKIAGRWKYDHPVLDTKAVRAQNEMYKIQNTRSISYAGAYLKYGFHEDGFTSGLLAACSIDDDQNSLPSAIAFTATLSSMSIPVRGLTVRPPFDIQHADHHLQLSRKGTSNSFYERLGWLFDWVEQSGIRQMVGLVGSLFLTVIGWFLGIN